MNIYSRKQWWKTLLLIFAVIIGISSVLYTNKLVKKLWFEEQKKVELWAEATKQLAKSNIIETDFSFLLLVIQNNRTVPVILTNKWGQIISTRNLDSVKQTDSVYLKTELNLMKKKHSPIVIDLGDGNKNFIYYKESTLLTQLRYYPYIQLSVIVLFILVAYFAFNTSRKAEQNRVWVGLTKETAHQLGTPTSSLMAWVEILKEKYPDDELIHELEKDIGRLEIITDRFSKIGSKPSLKPERIYDVICHIVSYLEKRAGERILFTVNSQIQGGEVKISRSLFEWVIENLCKNAIDAIEGKGLINIALTEYNKQFIIDITDSGKGIAKSKQKTIFKPGFTTKSRGWGLGLSLVKRIIEEYHKGKIFVLSSELSKGTTFRILINK